MSVNNSIVKEEKKKNIVEFVVDNVTVKLSPDIVRKFLTNGNSAMTPQEINLCLHFCRSRGLNPFVKDVYFIKYGDQPATIIVSKDAIERRAIKNPLYKGKKVGIYVLNNDGKLEKKDNTILLKTETLIGAWCEVYREGWDMPVKIDVNFEEYIGRKNNGTPNTNWGNRPVTMITKVAKVQALREAFIEELQGMYESDEITNIPVEVMKAAEDKVIPDNIENTDEIEIEEAQVVENYDKDTGEVKPTPTSDNEIINDIFG